MLDFIPVCVCLYVFSATCFVNLVHKYSQTREKELQKHSGLQFLVSLPLCSLMAEVNGVTL